jgi:hypothetical protein
VKEKRKKKKKEEEDRIWGVNTCYFKKKKMTNKIDYIYIYIYIYICKLHTIGS